MDFFVTSRLVIVGRNPEKADISNPRGEVYGEAFSVTAEARGGRRWEHDVSFDVAQKAEALRARVERAYAGGRPLNKAHWREIDPRYGSDDYVAQGTEGLRWAREREEENGWSA